MKESDQIDRIVQFLSGNLPDQERDGFLEWAAREENKSLFEETEKLWNLSAQYIEPDFEVDIAIAWDKVDGQLDIAPVQKEAPVRKLSFVRQFLRVAAVFLLVALSAWWFLNQDSTAQPEQNLVIHTTSTEELKEILLPDGSQIWLNVSSKLVYKKSFTERKVELIGEAFFDVAKLENKPFEIISGEAKTIVLGTAFNIRAYPAEKTVEVTVVRGKVALTEKAHPEKVVLLEKGNAGIFIKADKVLKKQKALNPNSDSWKTQNLVFDSTQMDEVIESLQRYFRIEIEVNSNNIYNCHFTGDFRNPTLDQIFQILEFGANLKVIEENGHYLLKGKGCEK